MKQLKFEHQYAEKIIDGTKTATIRFNDDKDIRVGDAIELVDKVDRDRPTSWLIQGVLEVMAVEQLPIKDLNEMIWSRAESFGSTAEMLEVFRRFYGDHLTLDSLVTAIYFSFHAYESPRPYLEQVAPSTVPMEVKLYADGGSRGNPGPSAAGYAICSMDDVLIHTDNRYLGITTNNQAEYHAAISAMEWCIKNRVRTVHVYLDSLLVINQMKGSFKVKNRDLWSLHERMRELQKQFSEVTFTHIPRELNKIADREVNKALDAVKGSDVVQ